MTTLLSTSMIEIPSLQELFWIESDMLTSFWPKFWRAYNIWKSGQSTLIRSGQSKNIFAITVLFRPRQRKEKKETAIKAITAGTCEPVHQRATFLFALNVQLYYLSFASTSFIFVLLEMRSNLVSNFQGTNQPLMWSFSPASISYQTWNVSVGCFFCLYLHYL